MGYLGTRKYDNPEAYAKVKIATDYIYCTRHREARLIRNKEHIICECGVNMTRGALSRHRNTLKHKRLMKKKVS